MILKKNQQFNFKELMDLNPIVLSWTGGSYGNFLYRTLHKFVKGLPVIQDDGSFGLNGNSHNYIQYINDFQDFDRNATFKVAYDIEFEKIIIKKHSSSKYSPNILFKQKKPFFHIKIIYKDKSSYIWATIQNILKCKDIGIYYPKDIIEIDWFKTTSNDISNVTPIFDKFLAVVNNKWYEEDTGTYSIFLEDFFNKDALLNHVNNISKQCNLELIDLDSFQLWYENFLNHQLFVSSLRNHLDNTYDNSFVDSILKHYSRL